MRAYSLRLNHYIDHVVAGAPAVKRSLRGPLQGGTLVLFLILVPPLEVQGWQSSSALALPRLVRVPLVAPGLIWLTISVALVTSVLRGRRAATNGMAWLAGVLVALVSTSSGPATAVAPTHSTAVVTTHQEPVHVDGTTHLLPMLLMARIRRDQPQALDEADEENSLDEVIAAEAGIDLSPLRSLHHFLAGAPAGIAAVPDDFDAYPELDDDDPVVVCRVRSEPGQTIVGYARVGTTLSLPNPWSANQLRDELVGLPNERLSFATTEAELLRALALRDSRTLVVYTGDASVIDDELKQRCVCVDTGAPTTASELAVAGVEVRLLQSTPAVLGLSEPFAPTLRRRCIEMVSYLALHDDPVTGDRLRSRVLVHADVDASKGTLLNTATAVRRALGADYQGPRLHPVSSAGLYSCHGVSSDIGTFHDEVRQGRRSHGDRAVAHYRRALALVRSEPLSSTTKGFDWFVLEGHLASLQRDGEWAALSLFEHYCDEGDFDEAFWALRQGLLLDPTNDVLRDALYQAPRLRQFGRDSAGTAQYQSVGTSGAVTVSRSLKRFRR